MRWVRHAAFMGEKKSKYKMVVGKPEEKRPLRRPGHRWEDKITKDLTEMG
jgi:hypothetical protein